MAADVIAVCGMRFEAAIAEGPNVRVVRAAGLADALPGCRGVVSFGCAGALDPMLRAGDCLLPETVLTPHGAASVDPAWRDALRRMLPYAHDGVLAGVDEPVRSAPEKAGLWNATGARAVDMESHRAALAARRHGLRFVALRVIVDPAGCNVPECAVAAFGADGTLSMAALMRSLAAHPSQLPALLSLSACALAARRSLHAARALAGPAFSLPGHLDGGRPSCS
ncbi:MAG: phosphorylase family protein [Telluria sp.]